MQPAKTQYARNGDVSLAYQVIGDGDLDIVYVPPFVSNVELAWEFPPIVRFYERLASFARLIVFDKRGTGLSDRVVTDEAPALEVRMDDTRAVMDAAGCERAALFGVSEGGPMSILFAASHPQRTRALVLFGCLPKYTWAPDFEIGTISPDVVEQMSDAWRAVWGEGIILQTAFARGIEDEATNLFLAKLERQGASPGAAVAILRLFAELDVRAALPTVSVPTLVLARETDPFTGAEVARYTADRIPGARLIVYPGGVHVPWLGNTDEAVDDIREFLTGTRAGPEPNRVLATVLFTDVVGSTERAAEVGDRRWRELLASHYTIVRRNLERFRGREIKALGDGFLATFDGPARAIRAACAIRDESRRAGLPIRAGVHTGECEIIDNDVGGIAVHIGARVASSANPDEVLVSSTVKDLVAGSGLAFEDRGVRPLKGVPGEWRIYAVTN